MVGRALSNHEKPPLPLPSWERGRVRGRMGI